MRNRFLKICVLFLSLALTALPMQQAFAAPAADMESSHCQDKSTTDSAQQAADFSTASAISNGCCCDHCDASCGNCSGVIGAMLLPVSASIGTHSQHEAYFSTYPRYTSRTTSPPSPPPLS